MARDIGRIHIPEPPNAYDPLYERMRNARIEELIRTRAAVNELAPYGGVPHAALIGTNAALATAGGGVATVLPFNIVFVANPALLDSTVPVLKLQYTMNLQLFIQLQHVSGAGGNSTVTINGLVNGVVTVSATQTVALNDNEVYSRSVFYRNVPPNQPLTFSISHTGGQPLIIDMIKSRIWVNQLTPDPKYLKSDSRPF